MHTSLAFKTLTEVLDHHARLKAAHTAYSFHYFPSDAVEKISFGELAENAKKVAYSLLSEELESKNVILIFSPGLQFIEVFFGCLYAGLHPIPMPAPIVQKQISRILNVLSDAEASAILTDDRLMSKLASFIPEDVKSKTKFLSRTNLSTGSKTTLPVINAEDTAFIQYTSGSVGAPKGVVISHRNILHNEMVIKEAFEHDETTSVVSWLPMFHDMGLIGNVLQPLYLGVHSVLMSPLAFIQKPVRWLELISRYRATTSGAPNFGYDMCVKNVSEEQKIGLDLSSWTLAYSGAEPVRSLTIKSFVTSFENQGFKEQAFYPCYGLAESTLFVTGVKKGESLKTLAIDATEYARGKVILATSVESSISLTSCGRPRSDQEVIIVDTQTLTSLSEGEVGEIWVRSDSKAMGYWNNPKETDKTFNARLRGTSSPTYLRTGDLGFIKGGDLFITARVKDTIIIRGANFYPQDIEHAIESDLGLPAGSTAAFSVEIKNEEKLIVLSEVPLNKIDAVETVTKTFGVRPYSVKYLDRGRLPRGSSGKLQRFLCKKMYLESLATE